MLQQTQVSRVLVKYPEFMSAFPDWESLARAPLSSVLEAWKGMGYARRALALKKIAGIVLDEYGGRLPGDYEALVRLPSVGKATAGSILAFAFGVPMAVIETNIRAVFIHFFFDGRDNVRDADIEPLVESTLDRRNPRKWYYALMDYGVYLKKRDRSLLGKSAHYRKQPRFRGSTRETRSRILALVSGRPGITRQAIRASLDAEQEKTNLCIDALAKEGFLVKQGRGFRISE